MAIDVTIFTITRSHHFMDDTVTQSDKIVVILVGDESTADALVFLLEQQNHLIF